MAGIQYDVMLSYNSEPNIEDSVNRIYEMLLDDGYSVWYDKIELQGGFNVSPMKYAVDNCKVFLCCATKGYFENQSRKDELLHADAQKKAIIFLRLEDIEDFSQSISKFISGEEMCFKFYSHGKSALSEELFWEEFQKLQPAIQRKMLGNSMSYYNTFSHSSGSSTDLTSNQTSARNAIATPSFVDQASDEGGDITYAFATNSSRSTVLATSGSDINHSALPMREISNPESHASGSNTGFPSNQTSSSSGPIISASTRPRSNQFPQDDESMEDDSDDDDDDDDPADQLFNNYFGDLNQAQKNKIMNIQLSRLNEPPGPRMIMELRGHLDSQAEGNFIAFASRLNLKKAQITSLQKAWCGGGSPVDTFLQGLSNRHYKRSVNELITFLQKDYRFIADFVEQKSRPGQNLEDYLTPKNTYELKERMETLGHEQSNNCWRYLAAKFGYDSKEINLIAASIRRNNMYSPTELLFNILFMQRPLMKVVEIFQAVPTDECRQIVAQYMKQIIGLT